MFLKNKTIKYFKKGELPFNFEVDKAFYPDLKSRSHKKEKRKKNGFLTSWKRNPYSMAKQLETKS